jgi:hypothetical protein
MQVEQIYQIVNTITNEVLGDSAVVQEDLSNVVEIGDTIANLGSAAFENYTRSLIDHIGKVVFVNRPYSGSAPSVLMDAWEYGSILEKIQAEMPTAQANDSWNLQDGQTYVQDTFRKPSVSAKFYNSKTTFETQMSFAERQVKSAFESVSQLNAFFSMIDTAIYNGQTVKTDSLIMRTINNAIAHTIANSFGDGTGTGYDAGTSVKAVNLLYMYNQQYPDNAHTNLASAMSDGRFIRFASYNMALYEDRMKKLSKLFNIGGKARFTPKDRLHFVMLNDFAKAADVYNQSDTFHDQFTALPNAETVPYWQGSGVNYDTNSISSINVTISGANDDVDIVANGIIGVMFDRDALGVCNQDRRVTTHYNARAEFFNNWYKVDAQYFNDFNENIVVFYAAVTE